MGKIKINNSGQKDTKGASSKAVQSRALDTTPQDISKVWDAAAAIGPLHPQGSPDANPTPECPPTREERVRAIMELMPARWVRGKTGKDEARDTAPFILITHDTVEAKMRAALERIEKDGHVAGRPRMIRIERL